MLDLILYIGLAAVGFLVGKQIHKKGLVFSWTGKVQSVALFTMVIFMGMRMGASEEVFRNLGTIGVSALIFTFFAQSISLLCISVTRRILKFDRYGNPDKHQENHTEDPQSGSAQEDAGGSGINSMTLIIFFAVGLGILFGHFVVSSLIANGSLFAGNTAFFDSFAGNVIRVGLCILLFLVGLDMSADNDVFKNIKASGAKILLFPVFSCVGALIGAVVSGCILSLSLKESLAIGAGFGWYTLAPGLIMDAGLINASAICFLHNVSRELVGILLIPMVAKRVGYIESTALAGAAAMDVCLPIVERATNSSVAVYSFISGVIISTLVPILVPLILTIF